MQGCVEGGVVELAGGKKWKREREERTNKRIEKWQPNLIYLAFVVGLPPHKPIAQPRESTLVKRAFQCPLPPLPASPSSTSISASAVPSP